MNSELIAYTDPKSPVSEMFKTLRTNIQFMNSSKELKTILITSTYPGEGKSWTASNLAVTFAQAGKSVLLIDADMRKGRQFHIFNVPPTPGLSNYLSGVVDGMQRKDYEFSDFIHKTEIDNLYVMTAGNVPPNPSELLISEKMLQMMAIVREMFDVTIFDGTPSLIVTDAPIISRLVDSTIMVTAHNETKMDDAEKTKKAIENIGGKVAGVVINKVPVSAKKYESKYYYYGSTNKLAETKPKKIFGGFFHKNKIAEDMFTDSNEEINLAKIKELDLTAKEPPKNIKHIMPVETQKNEMTKVENENVEKPVVQKEIEKSEIIKEEPKENVTESKVVKQELPIKEDITETKKISESILEKDTQQIEEKPQENADTKNVFQEFKIKEETSSKDEFKVLNFNLGDNSKIETDTESTNNTISDKILKIEDFKPVDISVEENHNFVTPEEDVQDLKLVEISENVYVPEVNETTSSNTETKIDDEPTFLWDKKAYGTDEDTQNNSKSVNKEVTFDKTQDIIKQIENYIDDARNKLKSGGIDD